METQKIWFVTGASKGFGLEIVKAALSAGDKVVAAVRRGPEQLTSVLPKKSDLLVVLLDVTDSGQAKTAVRQALDTFGRIDVLVNNAGFGLVGGIEEASDEEIQRQYDTNVFGLLKVTRAVLPAMRARRSGHIINISSLYGFGSTRPGWGIYGSTKFAVEGITESLALEVEPLGIRVTAVEPGLFRTSFLKENSFLLAKNRIEDYQGTVGAVRDGLGQRDGVQPGDPSKLGQAIVQLAHADHPPLHLPLGKDAVELYRNKTARLEKEISAWQQLTNSTGY